MADPKTAEDLLPLVAQLSPQERARFLRLMTESATDDQAYRALPTRSGEFSSDEEPLAWDADGWEDVG